VGEGKLHDVTVELDRARGLGLERGAARLDLDRASDGQPQCTGWGIVLSLGPVSFETISLTNTSLAEQLVAFIARLRSVRPASMVKLPSTARTQPDALNLTLPVRSRMSIRSSVRVSVAEAEADPIGWPLSPSKIV
jgi:hypothetical protein